jgi:zinc protease
MKGLLNLLRPSILFFLMMVLLLFTNGAFMTDSAKAQTLDLLRRKGNVLEGIQIKPLTYTAPAVRQVQIDDHARLYMLADDALPLVNLRLVFEGGTDSEEDAYGVTSALASYLKLGGAGNRSGEEVADALALLGASLDIRATDSTFIFQLSSLKDDFPAAMQILEDVLLRPQFDDAVLPVIKNSMRTSIQRRNDRPEQIAQRKLREVFFLPDRRGHSLQLADIDALDVERVRKAHHRLFARRNLHIALNGAYSQNTVDDISRLVRSMPAVIEPYSVYDRETSAKGIQKLRGKILLVKKDVSQAVVAIGTYLPAHNDRDFYSLQAGNYILGGGSFVSRLMQEVRAKRGLSYYSYSRNDFDARYGRFIAASGTRADRTAETLSVMLDVIGGMNRISEDELRLATDSIINSLVFEYDNPERLLAQQIRFRMHRLPEDYLSSFQDRMIRVTIDDVKRVFQKYVDPSQMWIVVVGPESLKNDLEKIRPVITIDPEESPL